jgi:8-oxo-dGTP pyrophosphatase MutT (NUDIX family)
MSSQSNGKRAAILQAGAVPYRYTDSEVEFCLITSTEGRWIFPKGNVRPGGKCWKTAMKEAVQEAGVRGNLLCRPLGAYDIVNDTKAYTLVPFLLEVTKCDDLWEEAPFRLRRWGTEAETRHLLWQPLGPCLDAAVARVNNPH